MTAKAKGRRQEHRSRAILEAAGYDVTRAAGSLGLFDLIGLGPKDVVAVQVKSRDWPGTSEMEQLEAYPRRPYLRKLVHRWRKGKGMPDVREL